MSQNLSIPEFAAKIKAKHKDYADIEDNELTRRVLEKFPEYRDHVNLGDEASAVADVNRNATSFENATNAYTSALGGQLNPNVSAGSDYFRKLSPQEQAAQQQGEPVIISQAGEPAIQPSSAIRAPAPPAIQPKVLQSATPPPQTVVAPTSDSDLHGEIGPLPAGYRQEQAKTSQIDVISNAALHQMATRRAQQAKQQAERKRIQDQMALARANAASAQLAGMRPDTVEGPPQPFINKQVTPVQDVVSGVNTPLANRGFELANQEYERLKKNQQARERQYPGAERANIAHTLKTDDELRAEAEQIGTEQAKREAQQPEIDKLASGYQDVIRQNAKVGAGPTKWTQETVHKIEGFLAPLFAGGARAIANPAYSPVGALLTDQQKAEQIAQFIEKHGRAAYQAAVAEGADRNAASKFTQDLVAGAIASSPELAAMMAGLPAPAVFALSGAIKSLGRGESGAKQVGAGLEGGAQGLAWEAPGLAGITRPLPKIGLVGAGTTAVNLASGQPVGQAVTGGLSNMLLAGIGELHEIPKDAADYVIQSPLTPEPVRDVMARTMKYGTGLVRSADGRNLSVYIDPKTGAVGGVEITDAQADKYDPSLVTGEARPIRNSKTVDVEDYEDLLKSLGVESKVPAKRLSEPANKISTEPTKTAEPTKPSENITESITKEPTVARISPSDEAKKEATAPVPVSPTAQTKPAQPPATAISATRTDNEATGLEPVASLTPRQVIEGEGLKYLGEQQLPKGGVAHTFDVEINGKPTTVMLKGEITPETVQAKVAEKQKQFAAQPEVAKPTSVETKVPEWVREDIDRKVKEADRLGISDQVEQLSAERLTAKEVAERIAKERNLNPNDVKELVRAVRSSRGIPSMDAASEFETWLTKRTPTPTETAAPAKPVESWQKFDIHPSFTGEKRAQMQSAVDAAPDPRIPKGWKFLPKENTVSFDSKDNPELDWLAIHPDGRYAIGITAKMKNGVMGEPKAEILTQQTFQGSTSYEMPRKESSRMFDTPEKVAAEIQRRVDYWKQKDDTAAARARSLTAKPVEVSAKPVEVTEPKVAEKSDIKAEPKSSKPPITEWKSRLKAATQEGSEKLDGVQAVLDEMAAHKGDPQVEPLRKAVRNILAELRQPKIKERPKEVESKTPTTSRVTKTRQEYVSERIKALGEGDDPIIAQRNAIQEHDYAVRKAVRDGKFRGLVGNDAKALAILQSLGERVPNYVKREIATLKGEAYEVTTKPSRPVGRPSSNPEVNSLETEIRAMGGLKEDKDGANAGEIAKLRESGKRGLVDPNGTTAERMAVALAEKGYGRGVFWEIAADGSIDPDGNALLDAAIESAAGEKPHYSSQRNEVENDPDVRVWDEIAQDETSTDLLRGVQSGHATASDIYDLTEQLKAAGLSERGLREFIRSLDEQVTEAVRDESPEGEGYELSEDGTLLDEDGTPLFARVDEYQGEHGAPDKEGGAPLHDVTSNGIYPDDIYSFEGRRYYGTGEDALDADAWGMIQRLRNKPNAPVWIYRAVPKDIKDSINDGDWVTTSRQYAVDHGKSALNGDYKILKTRAHARDLFTDGNSWLEWGYHPQPVDLDALRRSRLERTKRDMERVKNGEKIISINKYEGDKFYGREDEFIKESEAELAKQPQFAREHQLGFTDEGLTQQEAPRPKTPDQREQLRQSEQERLEAANPERAAAVKKLAELRRRGLSIDEYARQGSMFEAAPSAAEIKLLREIEKPQSAKPEGEQDRLFAKGETSTGQPLQVTVRGNQVEIDRAGTQVLSDAYRELGHLTKSDKNIRGVYQRQAERLASVLDEMAQKGITGAKELAAAVHQAIKNSPKSRIVLYSGEGTKRHEVFHEISDKSEKSLSGRHANFNGLIVEPTFTRAARELAKQGYDPNDKAAMLDEVAAHLAEGKYAELGVSRSEAVDFMTKWFKSFDEANPHVDPKEFKELADEAHQARVEVSQAAERQQRLNQAIQSLQEGREGGDRASLAREPDVTQTDAFKKWFGDSKVVDENGNPLVVYHGTAENFTEFDLNHPNRRDTGWLGTGVYVTTHPETANAYSQLKTGPSEQVIPLYVKVENPYYATIKDKQRLQLISSGKGTEEGRRASDQWTAELKAKGHDGVILRYKPSDVGENNAQDEIVVFDPAGVKSATGNRGTFDPNNPNILFAREANDPWERLSRLADEMGEKAEEPELPAGEKPRSLPRTLDMAGLESGPTKGYEPESIDTGIALAKERIAESGIDGAMEFVRSGDGIDWASTGYEVSAKLRDTERELRASGNSEAADEVQKKRLKFLDDFAQGAIDRGRSIVGIKAVAEYSPDRLAYELNKASLRKRKKGINPDTEKRITEIGDQLGDLQERYDALEKSMEGLAAKASERIRTRTGTSQKSGKAKKNDYQSKLDEQASTILQTLKPKVGKLDLSGIKVGEQGAIKIGGGIGIPPLKGDAELIAQYTASRLAKVDTVADLNAELVNEFGNDVEPFLPQIRQRAYAIRQEARLAEIEARDTTKERRRTILQEIQGEIADSLRTIQESKKAEDLARKAENAAEVKAERAEARLVRQSAAKAEAEARKQLVKDARAQLKQSREEYKEAAKRETQGWRATIKAQREAARKAELWDTPLRNEALAARERLKDATDPNDPQVMADLVSVAQAHFLPPEEGGSPRSQAIDPSSIYVELKKQFPKLVTRKNQGKIYKEAYEKYHDMIGASKQAARLRSANAESKRLWDELGMDVDAQGVLIEQAHIRRKQFDLRRKAEDEFNRVSQSKWKRFLFEVGALPRSLRSSIDAPLGRQGLYYAMTHPILTFRESVPAGAKGYAALRHEDYINLQDEIASHPRYDMARRAGVDLTEMASKANAAVHAEEQQQSPVGEKIPHVRISEQAYISEMNVIRLEVFDLLARSIEAEGKTFKANPEAFQQAAALVNVGSGRGQLGPKAQASTSWLGNVFWSTKLGVSRFQLINQLFNPFKYLPEKGKTPEDERWYQNPAGSIPGFDSYDPALRKYMLWQVAKLGAVLAGLYGLARMSGADVKEFPVIRFGNTRYDLSNGEVSNARFILKLFHALSPSRRANDPDISEVTGHYLRGKLAPVPGAAVDVYYGKDFGGEPVNTWPFVRHPVDLFESTKTGKLANENIFLKQILPMVVYDFSDAIGDSGWSSGILKGLPALSGISTSTYPDRGLKAIKNQQVADELERLGFTNTSLLGQKTKNQVLDEAIQASILNRVEDLKIPQGATEIGEEKLVRERLEQMRALAKAEVATQHPEQYAQYLKEQDAGLSFLNDQEKAKLTEKDITKYRTFYADSYLDTLKIVTEKPEWKQFDDDTKEKVLNRIERVASTVAKRKMIGEVRPQPE